MKSKNRMATMALVATVTTGLVDSGVVSANDEGLTGWQHLGEKDPGSETVRGGNPRFVGGVATDGKDVAGFAGVNNDILTVGAVATKSLDSSEYSAGIGAQVSNTRQAAHFVWQKVFPDVNKMPGAKPAEVATAGVSFETRIKNLGIGVDASHTTVPGTDYQNNKVMASLTYKLDGGSKYGSVNSDGDGIFGVQTPGSHISSLLNAGLNGYKTGVKASEEQRGNEINTAKAEIAQMAKELNAGAGEYNEFIEESLKVIAAANAISQADMTALRDALAQVDSAAEKAGVLRSFAETVNPLNPGNTKDLSLLLKEIADAIIHGRDLQISLAQINVSTTSFPDLNSLSETAHQWYGDLTQLSQQLSSAVNGLTNTYGVTLPKNLLDTIASIPEPQNPAQIDDALNLLKASQEAMNELQGDFGNAKENVADLLKTAIGALEAKKEQGNDRIIPLDGAETAAASAEKFAQGAQNAAKQAKILRNQTINASTKTAALDFAGKAMDWANTALTQLNAAQKQLQEVQKLAGEAGGNVYAVDTAEAAVRAAQEAYTQALNYANEALKTANNKTEGGGGGDGGPDGR